MSSVQPGSTIDIKLSVTTDVALAGATVHITYSNASYAGFASANSSALSFVDYHVNQADVVYICNNNNCQPGSYDIATITVKAAQTGTVSVTFTPKETADPQLNLMAADGGAGSYAISGSAPATPAKKNTKNTFTVPQDSGTGSTVPLQVTDDELADQVKQSDKVNEQGEEAQPESKSFWTTNKMLLAGVGLGALLSFIVFILFQLFGSGGPRGSGGMGTTIYPN